MQFRQGPAHGNPCNTYSQTESYSALTWNSVVPSRVSGPATAQQVAAVHEAGGRPRTLVDRRRGSALTAVGGYAISWTSAGRPRREARAGSQPAPERAESPGGLPSPEGYWSLSGPG